MGGRKNTGKEYEKLTQRIFSAILNKKGGPETIDVRHDVTLLGKTTSHQIDVLWCFEHAGIEYQTLVQCKDHGDPVKKGDVLLFRGVLEDIPGQPRGVIVARSGFQKGALEVGQAHGIVLHELRRAADEDWSGYIRTVVVHMNLYVPTQSQISICPDDAWNRQEARRLGFKSGDQIPFHIDQREDEMELFNAAHDSVGTMHDVLKRFYPSANETMEPTRLTHSFEEPTFIATGIARFPFLRLASVSALVSVGLLERELTVEADEVVTFILKNVIEGDELRFDHQLNLVGDD